MTHSNFAKVVIIYNIILGIFLSWILSMVLLRRRPRDENDENDEQQRQLPMAALPNLNF
jgi:hypothetical protein